jgi:hypothetical protein
VPAAHALFVQVYLIEVNTCPALCRHGAVLEDLLPRVIEEAVQKAIDPFFPASGPSAAPSTARPSVAASKAQPSSASSDAKLSITAEETQCGKETAASASSIAKDVRRSHEGVCRAQELNGFQPLVLETVRRYSLMDRSSSFSVPRCQSISAGCRPGVCRGHT